MDIIDRPSPNFDERMLPVSMIVLHYTGMADAEVAIRRLTVAGTEVINDVRRADLGECEHRSDDRHRRRLEEDLFFGRGVANQRQ